jgi:hypothetical protein
MVLAGQFRRACAVSVLGAAIASVGIFAATFSTEMKVIAPDVQKIQFDSSGQLQLNRPGKVHASRTGGHTDVELSFNGKTSQGSVAGAHAFRKRGPPLRSGDNLLTDCQPAFT